MYRAMQKYNEGHRYFRGCNLLLQWWILIHLAKGAGTQEIHTFDNKNTLKDFNDMLYWANMDNRRTRGRWAQIFSELREEDLRWILPFHPQRSHCGDSQTGCASSTRYSGNSPLCILLSLATVREQTNNIQRGVLWRVCIPYWRRQSS